MPVWPGGYLLGSVLLVNLLAAHIKRFTLSRKKIGLFLIHAGLILLFVGQFLTETFQIESFMRLEEGETKSYTESARKNELAIIDISNPDREQVVSIPQSRLAAKEDIRSPGLPFTLRVKEYFSKLRACPAMKSVAGAMERLEATQGVGQRLFFRQKEFTTRSDEDNVPAALVEVVTPQGSLGSWTVSTWLAQYGPRLRENLGQMGSFSISRSSFLSTARLTGWPCARFVTTKTTASR